MSSQPTSNTNQAIADLIQRLSHDEKLSAVTLSAIVIAKRLRQREIEKWLKLELNGYFQTNSEYSGEPIPQYRTVVGEYFDYFRERIKIQEPELYFVRENRLPHGIQELEAWAYQTKSCVMNESPMFKLIEEHFGIVVSRFVFAPSEVAAILNQLKTELLNRLLELEEVCSSTGIESSAKPSDVSSVFVVHGRDDQAKIEIARFIEQLGFNAIILHEQVDGGKTIIEKIEQYTDVGFGVVIYTPCDVGALKGEETIFRPRPRQNVVFEHGFLMGKLGRDKVCAIVKGEVELLSDISGVVYKTMDDHQAWKTQLAQELYAAGYPVDFNKLFQRNR